MLCLLLHFIFFPFWFSLFSLFEVSYFNFHLMIFCFICCFRNFFRNSMFVVSFLFSSLSAYHFFSFLKFHFFLFSHNPFASFVVFVFTLPFCIFIFVFFCFWLHFNAFLRFIFYIRRPVHERRNPLSKVYRICSSDEGKPIMLLLSFVMAASPFLYIFWPSKRRYHSFQNRR